MKRSGIRDDRSMNPRIPQAPFRLLAWLPVFGKPQQEIRQISCTVLAINVVGFIDRQQPFRKHGCCAAECQRGYFGLVIRIASKIGLIDQIKPRR